MSRMGNYVLEKQEQAAIRGEVDDPNDLQGGEQEEYEQTLNLINTQIADAIHKLKLEQNHENR